MAFPIIVLSLLAFCPCTVPAARIRQHHQLHQSAKQSAKQSANETASASAEALVAGKLVLSDRFELVQSLWRQDLYSRRLQHAPLSTSVTQRFGDTKELYAGSFGEAWSAVDRQTGKKVVLKMFYTQDPARPGQTKILTWNMARQLTPQNPQISSNLEDAAAECTTARNLQAGAAHDPVGASRHMQCFEDHVTRGQSTTGHRVGDNDQLYQVLEDCGTLPLSKWIENNRMLAYNDPDGYLKKSLRLFKQMMEALSYLQYIQYVHHDLKPDNMVVKVLDDGNEVLKFIDFGAVTHVSYTNAQQPAVSTIPFAPPEWFPPAHGFDYRAPWSYDGYAIAVTFDEMMTGKSFFDKLLDEAQKTGLLTQRHMDICLQKMMMGRVPQDQAQQACGMEVQMDAVKDRSKGSEYRLTHSWGSDRTVRYRGVRGVGTQTVTESWFERAGNEVPKLQNFLFAQERVDAAYDGVVRRYQEMALRSHWFPIFMAMISYEADARPTPQSVLDSRLLSDVDEVLDTSSMPHQPSRRVASPAGVLPEEEQPIYRPARVPSPINAPPPVAGEPTNAVTPPVARQAELELLGRGMCRAADDGSVGSARPSVSCVSLRECKEQCGSTCAGIAWAAAPTDKSICRTQDRPRCIVYEGEAAARTSSSHQEYKCYRPVHEHKPDFYEAVEVVQQEPVIQAEPKRDPPMPCPIQSVPGKLMLCITKEDGNLLVVSEVAVKEVPLK